MRDAAYMIYTSGTTGVRSARINVHKSKNSNHNSDPADVPCSTLGTQEAKLGRLQCHL